MNQPSDDYKRPEHHPEPCLRCGSTRPLREGDTTQELYVYTARLRLYGPRTCHDGRWRLDINTDDDQQLARGRVCGPCTRVVVDFLKTRPAGDSA